MLMVSQIPLHQWLREYEHFYKYELSNKAHVVRELNEALSHYWYDGSEFLKSQIEEAWMVRKEELHIMVKWERELRPVG